TPTAQQQVMGVSRVFIAGYRTPRPETAIPALKYRPATLAGFFRISPGQVYQLGGIGRSSQTVQLKTALLTDLTFSPKTISFSPRSRGVPLAAFVSMLLPAPRTGSSVVK